MSLSENKRKLDMLFQDSDTALLKTQVNLIRLSKVIPNPVQLKQKTGINIYNIQHILKNQNNILEKWKKHLKEDSLPGTHADNCNGIDILLLEWIKRCKAYEINLTASAITTNLMNLTETLKISPPYYMKPNIWAKIDKILRSKSNVVKYTNNKECVIPYTILQILKNDGIRLLKPQTYQRFLQTIDEPSLDTKTNIDVSAKTQETKEIKTRSKTKIDISRKRSTSKADNDLYSFGKTNKTVKTKRKSLCSEIETNASTTSFCDFPPLMTVNFENMAVPAIKVESLKHSTCHKVNTSGRLTSKIVKEEEIDKRKEGDKNEFLDIFEDQEIIKGKACKQLSARREKSKQESDALLDHQSDVVEIVDSGEEDNNDETSICNEIKEEPELIMDDERDFLQTAEEEEFDYNETEADVKLENFNITSTTIDDMTKKQFQNFDDHLGVINEINTVSPKDVIKNIEDDDDESLEIKVVFEIEDSDDETKNELLQIINKYASANPDQDELIIAKTDIKEDENASDEEVVLEILSDSDDDDDKVNGMPEQPLKKLKRNCSEITDDLPTTSATKLTFVDFESISMETTQKPCLNSTQSPDFSSLKITSNIEAFKYLHCIKHYFKSQNDCEASELVTRIMMSFMISGDAQPKKNL